MTFNFPTNQSITSSHHQKYDASHYSDLTPYDLDSITKIQKLLSTTQKTIENEVLYRNNRYNVGILDLRDYLIRTAANEVFQRYNSEIALIAQEVVKITKQVSQFILESPVALEEKKSVILSNRLQEIRDDVLNPFYEKVDIKRIELKALPLATDQRSFKKNIAPFNDLGLSHPTYLNQVKIWKQQQVIADNASEEDCWKWKGRLKAIKHIQKQCASLINSLYEVECCLTSLQNNMKNKQFYDLLNNQSSFQSSSQQETQHLTDDWEEFLAVVIDYVKLWKKLTHLE